MCICCFANAFCMCGAFSRSTVLSVCFRISVAIAERDNCDKDKRIIRIYLSVANNVLMVCKFRFDFVGAILTRIPCTQKKCNQNNTRRVNPSNRKVNIGLKWANSIHFTYLDMFGVNGRLYFTRRTRPEKENVCFCGCDSCQEICLNFCFPPSLCSILCQYELHRHKYKCPRQCSQSIDE